MKQIQTLDKLFEQIALEHLHIETLETQNRDRYDFHDVAVWSIKSALKAAYEAGVAAAKKSPQPTKGQR
jgi:hypothetical protein